MKVFPDDKLNVVQTMIYDFDRVENIPEKGQNAGYQKWTCLTVHPSMCLCVCPSVYKMLISVKALAGVLSHI